MGNHLLTTPKLRTVMYLSKDKKRVITETTIIDERPVEYFQTQLLVGIGKTAGKKG